MTFPKYIEVPGTFLELSSSCEAMSLSSQCFPSLSTDPSNDSQCVVADQPIKTIKGTMNTDHSKSTHNKCQELDRNSYFVSQVSDPSGSTTGTEDSMYISPNERKYYQERNTQHDVVAKKLRRGDWEEEASSFTSSPNSHVVTPFNNRNHKNNNHKRPRCSDDGSDTLDSNNNANTNLSLPPRKPRSAYILFFKSVRDKNLAAVKKRREKLMNMEVLIETVDNQWKALSSESRQHFEMLSQQETEQYQQALKEYERQQQQQRQNAVAPLQKKEYVNRTELIPPIEPVQTPTNKKAKVTEEHSDSWSSNLGTFGTEHNERNVLADSRHTSNLDHASPQVQGHSQQMNPSEWTPIQYGNSLLNMPLPNGLEIEVATPPWTGQVRRYRVQYSLVSMTREQAEEYYRAHTQGANHYHGPSPWSEVRRYGG